MMNTTTINIEEVLGHLGKVTYTSNGYFGNVTKSEEGRVIYSLSNQSLFFLPKGSRSTGYLITGLLDFELIRKDNKKHKENIEQYLNREQLEEEYLIRQRERYERHEQSRKERWEMEKQAKEQAIQKEINEAKSLGGYQELEEEVFAFYKQDGGHYNEKWIKDTIVPLLNKLIHKSIDDMSDYPKYYFDKKHNPKFCSLLESKLDIKLKNTQKGNVELLNNYLKK